MRLEDRVAIVTGAARGIGRAIAFRLAEDGAAATAADVDMPGAEATAKGIEARGGKGLAVRADVTVAQDVEAMVAATLKRFGRVDILVNNAGIVGPTLPIQDYPESEWSRVLAVNLTGTFLCSRAVVPHMLVRRGGRIINIASVAGKEGNPNMTAYHASKGGVIALTKGLAKEVATAGITVNCITPALIDTDMAKAMPAEHSAMLASRIPMGRLGRPEEVAAVVAFLASDEASFVTGACYDVSGGRSDY